MTARTYTWTMASKAVREAFNAVIEEAQLQVECSRVKERNLWGEGILKRVGNGEAEQAAFDAFASELSATIQNQSKQLCGTTSSYCTVAGRREKLWSSFHQLRLLELPKVWKKFISSIGVPTADTLFQQSVNQKLFEALLPLQFLSPFEQKSCNTDVALTKDELNSLQYACGYVPRSLLKKYEKYSGQRYEKYIECLGEMDVQSEEDHDTLLDFTKEWVDKVNHGGLFPLNDSTFLFFVSVEKVVRVLLPKHMMKSNGSSSTDTFKEHVIEEIIKDENVQWHWTLLSQCIDLQEDAHELLQEVVQLWVTIRGFSITASWMECYKCDFKTTTKKKHSLRQELSLSK